MLLLVAAKQKKRERDDNDDDERETMVCTRTHALTHSSSIVLDAIPVLARCCIKCVCGLCVFVCVGVGLVSLALSLSLSLLPSFVCGLLQLTVTFFIDFIPLLFQQLFFPSSAVSVFTHFRRLGNIAYLVSVLAFNKFRC